MNDASTLCHGCFEAANSGAEPCPKCGWDNTQQTRGNHLDAGQILHDRYILGRLLGQGGFGITYLGFDKTLNTKVVVKEYLYTTWASRVSGTTTVQAHTGKESDFSEGVNSFLNEARILAQFKRHFYIVTVTDFFQANGTGYLVMDYEPGIDLKKHLANQPDGVLPWRQALPIFVQVMDALRTTHAVNLIHRDISPDNIYVTEDGQALVLDFGNARHYDAEKSQSFSAVLKDGYAPPEQYSRKGKQGPWTDVYSLGATLYRALSGETPSQALDRQPEDDLKPIETLVPDLPPELVQVIQKALSLKVSERYQSIAEMLQPLIALLRTGGAVLPQEPEPQPEVVNTVEIVPPPAPGQNTRNEARTSRIAEFLRSHPAQAISATILVLVSVGLFYANKKPELDTLAAKVPVSVTQPKSVVVPMSRLTMKTEPTDAKIEIVEPAQEYRSGMELKPGAYRIKISAAGYQTLEQTLTLDPGEQKPYYSLIPALAKLTVNRTPADANVIVKSPDGSHPEYQDGMELKPGNYQIEISKKGYKTRSEQMELAAGELQQLKVALAEVVKPVVTQPKPITYYEKPVVTKKKSVTTKTKPKSIPIHEDDFWNKQGQTVTDFLRRPH